MEPATRSESANQTVRTKSMVLYQEYFSVLQNVASSTAKEKPYIGEE